MNGLPQRIKECLKKTKYMIGTQTGRNYCALSHLERCPYQTHSKSPEYKYCSRPGIYKTESDNDDDLIEKLKEEREW